MYRDFMLGSIAVAGWIMVLAISRVGVELSEIKRHLCDLKLRRRD